MNPHDHRERSSSHPARCLAFGLITGASLGAIELSVRLWSNTDASIARRVPTLLAYAALWPALLGAAGCVVANRVARLGERSGWRTAREGADALLIGTVVALCIPITLLLLLGIRLQAHPPVTRASVMVLILIASALSGWFVARRLAARPGGRIASVARRCWAPRLLAVAFLAAGIAAGGSSWGSQRSVAAAASSRPLGAAETNRPSVLLILVDTLRADALGCYGAETPTPAIDALAARGALFEAAIAPASWTLPSVASLFTSTPPRLHGCVDFNTRIAPLDSLAETLAGSGYECMAAVGNPFVNEGAGFARGFHVYDVYSQAIESRLWCPRIFDQVLRLTGMMHGPRQSLPWLDVRSFPPLETRLSSYRLDQELNESARAFTWPGGERPYLLYVQYVAPHTPYLDHPLPFLKNQPPLVEENLATLRERYAREVLYTDTQVEHLLHGLEQDGLLEETYVVIVSDHGEEFLEHGGWEHGYGLYQEVVHIPLIIAGPGIEPGARISERVELMDVGPTLLELLGLPTPESFMGHSLASRLRNDGQSAEDRIAICEIGPSALTPEHRTVSAMNGRFKIVRKLALDKQPVSEEVFDLQLDPTETSPLPKLPEETGALLAELEEYLSQEIAGGSGADPLHSVQQLQDLGYVDGDTD